MVRLLALPPLLLEDLDAGRLTVGHARALLSLPQPDAQVALRQVVIERGLSVRETERLVQRERSAREAPPGALAAPALDPAQALQFQAVREMLEQRLATRVGIQPDEATGAGRIEIEYYSLDDFNRLYELLVR
jgi:ParB family chromosome partitioning protein